MTAEELIAFEADIARLIGEGVISRDEGLAYADRLRAAGVPVALELYRGLTHDFIKMGRVLKEASLAQQAAADALKNAWSTHP